MSISAAAPQSKAPVDYLDDKKWRSYRDADGKIVMIQIDESKLTAMGGGTEMAEEATFSFPSSNKGDSRCSARFSHLKSPGLMSILGDYFRGDSGPPPPVREMDSSVDSRVRSVASQYLHQWNDLKHELELIRLPEPVSDNMQTSFRRAYNKGIHAINETQRDYATYLKDISAITTKMAAIVELSKSCQRGKSD